MPNFITPIASASLGDSPQVKVEIAFAMMLARRLPLATKPLDGFKAVTTGGIDKQAFISLMEAHGGMQLVAQLNEQYTINISRMMSYASDLWCARMRVAYPLPTAYIPTVVENTCVMDLTFNYKALEPKDYTQALLESQTAIVQLSNNFGSLI